MFISEMFIRVCYRWNGFRKEHQGNTILCVAKISVSELCCSIYAAWSVLLVTNHSFSVMKIVCRMFAVTYWCVGLYCVSDTYRHTKISTSIPLPYWF